MEISVKQSFTAAEEMSIFGQYQERGITVMTSCKSGGNGTTVGRVVRLWPKGDGFRLQLELTKRLKSKSKEGFVFTNFYGTWFITRPE